MNEPYHICMSHITYIFIYVEFEWVVYEDIHVCRIWMSRVTSAWVISHMYPYMSYMNVSYIRTCRIWMSKNESRYICMSHITHIFVYVEYEWVVYSDIHMCRTWMSRVIYACVISHIYSHMSYMNMSYILMRRVWMSHVTCAWVIAHLYSNESRHICMSHITYIFTCVVYDWFTSHMHEACHTYIHTYRIWISRIFTCVVYEWVTSYRHEATYGVASISRLLKITGLFCKRAL